MQVTINSGCGARACSSLRGSSLSVFTPVLLERRLHMRKAILAGLATMLSVALISGVALGQTAQVTGHVTDPQGAVVANATVVAHNLATGAENTAQTTSDG